MKINTSVTAKLSNIEPFIETKISFNDTLTEQQKNILKQLALEYVENCKSNLKRIK